MKVSSLALAAVILIHGHQQQVARAFAPSKHQLERHQRPSAIASPTTALFTATSSSVDLQQVQTQLSLDYSPISPFGKNAGPPIAGGKHILGGKGANLAEMSELGLSVPPGFTITTECCDKYCKEWSQELPPELWNQIVSSLTAVEEEMDSQFGSPENPLLLSVRSGAAISMPGMMDTVLNLGMNDQVVEGMATKTGNARFAWDSYRYVRRRRF